ncbi:MAG: hypothetical protein KY462_14925 [Actinobacteria bacterium]|nr:hypothetical protein [Actinomycetota bacterium]
MARALADLPTTLERRTRPWHAMAVDDVLEQLGTSLDGLPEELAAERRGPSDGPPSAARLLARSVGEELINPLTPVLAAGAGLSLATGAVTDAALVATVVGLNAAIGGAQRFRTERAIAALEQRGQQHVSVRRDGGVHRVAAGALAPGDVIELSPGEAVPADCRIIAATGFLRRLPPREILDASVGLAVAAVPEGLPLLATVAQLAAARRLSRRSVLVRNPRAVEALGRVDVVCADKTGTLTEGRIRLAAVSDGVREVVPDRPRSGPPTTGCC